ncbi:hypothetical protein AAZX31_19G157200 [Glycine max]|uniref:Uncharacterized protein n=2 Tax=Glycine subgen. Soja TaxID=1462606 RepID=I1N9Y2_SOYBN|nr:protein NLRC3 [Glycine max]XP_028218861.1 protein NLRC3-like [Glycine soja]KAG5086490.1 hypothetical protein JHK82_053887 [Glycine max]KAH1078281.1 hypothetical protein GYH30_053333 [Glycine max]KAH1195110.1 Protein NLRC5 [Glycine max]KHN02437.1 Protein NLRC3 [Glycine soja]KRG95793.1 hypothetical protein GLYMA_19G171100v4 [Glycine max]|eukprot:XP_006604527.1 protein NLRC3 [Glycine max]
MAEAPPSLISLCIDALAQQFLRPSDDLPSIYDLPSHLLHTLITRLPPFALRTFHRHHLPFDEEGFSRDDSTKKRKRARDWNLSSAWQRLFLLRWPDRVKQIQPTDWEQHYWEIHLQDCLDEAAEVALIPSFSGYIGDIQISDSILKYIGFVGNTSHSSCDHSKLSYHCLQFGSHVSCLMLQNVLCTAETSVLLRECKLQSLVLRCIRSKEQIDGLCKLLAQHCRMLTSLEFVHCTLSTDFINAIFGSLVIERVQKHGIQHLSIIATSFLEPCAVSLPSGLMSFLSSGRSLCSLKLSDNQHGRTFAKDLFVTLLNLSSGISVLDLSENRIAGWLSDFNRRFLSGSHMSFGNGKSLKLLRVLNLRENNLGKDDVESLRYALQHVPNLEELDISGNSIEDEGIRNLIPYFVGASETCPHITCLKLENCDLSCVGVNNLLHILSNFKGPLKSLSIADNYLGSQVAEALGKFFSTPIEVLDIAGIGLGSYGFQELQSLIKEKVKLVKINISKNRGGIATAKFLSKLLSQAPQLVDVNAASNLMPIESLAIICSALKFAKGNVQQVDLTGHIWDYKPEHVSPYTEFVHNGLPILILPSSSASAAPHDHDP